MREARCRLVGLRRWRPRSSCIVSRLGSPYRAAATSAGRHIALRNSAQFNRVYVTVCSTRDRFVNEQ
jgi:hypothetical protein